MLESSESDSGILPQRHFNLDAMDRSRAAFQQPLLPPTLKPSLEPIPERRAVDFEPQRPAAHTRRPRMIPQILRRDLIPRSRQLTRCPDALFEFLADPLDLATHHWSPRWLDPPGPHLAQPGNQRRNALVVCHSLSLHAVIQIPIPNHAFYEPDAQARDEMLRKPSLARRAPWMP
jgi:hypothetical protein